MRGSETVGYCRDAATYRLVRRRDSDVDFTALAEEWVLSLGDDDYTAMIAAIELLEEQGPVLGRPAVDRIQGSRHHNMKELRSFGGYLRALSAFAPERHAVVLLGGDKRGDRVGWYERHVPLADDLFDRHLDELDNEG